jgi:hypothetical protein
MAVNSSNSITAEVYNGLQSRISKILGVGENTFGYGQPVSSSPVEQITDLTLLDGDSILAQQLNNLRSDFNTVNEHQQGEPTDINSFSQGDIVGADQSGTDIDHQLDGSKTFLNGDATKGINDFFALIDTLESNRFNIAVNQQEINVLSSSVRTNSWNGLIDTIFLVEFASANDRRYFFNAGGEIRFQGTVTNVSTQRGSFWNDLIENPGEIQFDYNTIVNTGSSNGVSLPSGVIGNYDLTQSYQTILRKDASSGLYGDSFWQIEAREQTSSSISFRITLVNDGPESDSDAGRPGSIAGGIQESVAADIEFELSTLSAANAVTVSSPSASVTNSF